MDENLDKNTKPGQEPPAGEGSGGVSELWRLLNEPGHMAESDVENAEDVDSQIREQRASEAAEIKELERRSLEASQRKADQAAAREAEKPAEAAPARADEHWSQIRRILETPDEVDESFDMSRQSRVSAGEDDADPAILAFMREETLVIRCRKHPTVDAKAQCPECQAYYCGECLVVRKGRLLCRDCADTIFVPTEEEVLSAAERGGELPEEQVMPTQAPEFQIGSELFGREGAPTNPLKQLLALLVDLAISRGLLFVILWLLAKFDALPSQLFAVFGPEAEPMSIGLWFKTFILGLPPVPWLVLFFFTDFVYYFISLGFTNRSPGMSAMGCRISTVWGDFVSFGAVATRTLIFLITLGVPGIIMAFFIPHFRGLHDILAGTIVINYAGVKRVDAYETIQIKL
ncbi:RDD family protein [bacterium]|nr:RDD family protein [bacterium]